MQGSDRSSECQFALTFSCAGAKSSKSRPISRMKITWVKVMGMALVLVIFALLLSAHPEAKVEGMVDFVGKVLMLLATAFMFCFYTPIFGVLAIAVLFLPPILGLVLRLAHIPNYAIGTPAGVSRWTNLAPPDILFRLASLAAANLVLYWLPIYYSSTYAPSDDDRSGFVLIPSIAFCPVSWVLGALCYVQVWQCRQAVPTRYKLPFWIITSMLLLVILSTIIGQARLYIDVCSVGGHG